ncbi:putative beta-ketoacyl synthase, N-domain protein [Mycobacterium xenopi 3993]|nr:putative beta-ketoacyl synthase, N-domain protein [Mycobacterium xenopi 3993]
MTHCWAARAPCGRRSRAGVTEFAVGDRVMGFFPDGSGTMVAGDVRLLLPIPADWSYAEAAGISAVFTTAYYAFRYLADVKPGSGC